MILPIFVRRILYNKMGALLISTVLIMTSITDLAIAKRGSDNESRSEFYGIIQARPQNGWQGEWVIGERTFVADQGTEFDETEGLLSVGSCAKVHIRNGRVHEIDSEPMQDCQ